VESYEMTLEAGFDIHRRIQWNSPAIRVTAVDPTSCARGVLGRSASPYILWTTAMIRIAPFL
jgi:hypothetical protein